MQKLIPQLVRISSTCACLEPSTDLADSPMAEAKAESEVTSVPVAMACTDLFSSDQKAAKLKNSEKNLTNNYIGFQLYSIGKVLARFLDFFFCVRLRAVAHLPDGGSPEEIDRSKGSRAGRAKCHCHASGEDASSASWSSHLKPQKSTLSESMWQHQKGTRRDLFGSIWPISGLFWWFSDKHRPSLSTIT